MAAELHPKVVEYLEGNATRQRELGEAILHVTCDGPGCTVSLRGTGQDRKRAGWLRGWRRIPGTGIEQQVDLCSKCRRGNGVWPPKRKDA